MESVWASSTTQGNSLGENDQGLSIEEVTDAQGEVNGHMEDAQGKVNGLMEDAQGEADGAMERTMDETKKVLSDFTDSLSWLSDILPSFIISFLELAVIFIFEMLATLVHLISTVFLVFQSMEIGLIS